jgi:hypothetical protein
MVEVPQQVHPEGKRDAVFNGCSRIIGGAHNGVPGRTLFGQDKIELLLWRMQQKGLEKLGRTHF